MRIIDISKFKTKIKNKLKFLIILFLLQDKDADKVFDKKNLNLLQKINQKKRD